MMLGLTLTENADLKKEAINTLINFLIIFGLSMIPDLLAVPGLPSPVTLWRSFLVGLLAALVFLAGNRGIPYLKTR